MGGKRWTESEATRLKELYAHHTPAECARLLGRSTEAIIQKASALKLKTDPELRANAWTTEHVELLKELYRQLPASEIAVRMGRSPSAVVAKAYKLGLATTRWTEEESALLKEQYRNTSTEELARQLNRSASSIYARAVQLGLRRTEPWTEEDIALLKELYPNTPCREVARQLGRSVSAVRVRASHLGLKRVRQESAPVKWTADQVALLKALYPGHTAAECAERLGRTVCAVKLKAASLGLKSAPVLRPDGWTQEQVMLLKEIYPHSTPAEAAARIGRDRRSVIHKASSLGLQSVSMWSEEEAQYLEQSWGKVSTDTIARKLNRTQRAVANKATKLGLGFSADAGSYITLPRLLQALDRAGSGNQCAMWRKRGLPVHVRRISDQQTLQVVYRREFWRWAEENRTFIDFSRVERGILGKEPEWVAEQRKLDRESASRYRRRIPWTPEEDEKLIRCLKRYRHTMKDICSMFGRSSSSVKNRIQVLGLSERPVPDIRHPWTPEDMARLCHLRERGMSYELIAEELGRTPAAVSKQYRTVTKRARMATGLSA